MKRVFFILALLATFASVAFASSVFAHEVRPAYLELRQTGTETYDALWKVPGQGDLRLGLYVELPASCANVTEPRGSMANNAFTERWTVTCSGGLTGGTIHIAGLTATMTDVLVRIERIDGTTQVTRLTPANPSLTVEASPDNWEVVRTYSTLGVEHILTGVDHLLFVLALLIIARGGWMIVKTVTAFTIAHSITLTAATLGFVHVPQRPVEAVIALSIVFVAAEIMRLHDARCEIRDAGREKRDTGCEMQDRRYEMRDTSYGIRDISNPGSRIPSLTARAPWIVALAFGLLHGFGFASALSEVGLPQAHIPLALLFFNVGVEIGQLLFIASVFAIIALARQVTRHIAVPQLAWAWRVPPYAIGSAAAFWIIQRIVAF